MMSIKILAAGSVALMGAGSFMGATAANALAVSDCGTEPTGVTISTSGDYCQLVMDSSANNSVDWTIPAGATDVWALLVGAGGGAGGMLDNDRRDGYAGNGGDVEYVDLTSEAAGTTLTLAVGEGGASNYLNNDDYAEYGNNTLVGDGTDSWSADGGWGNNSAWINDGPNWGWCGNGFAGEGVGAGDAGAAPTGEACVGGGPGIIPAEDPNAPEIFADIETEFGRGGGAYVDTSRDQGIGQGASIYNYGISGEDIGDEKGSDGYLLIRWTPSLASTGVDANSIGMTAGALSLGGIALAVVAAARRARRNK